MGCRALAGREAPASRLAFGLEARAHAPCSARGVGFTGLPVVAPLQRGQQAPPRCALGGVTGEARGTVRVLSTALPAEVPRRQRGSGGHGRLGEERLDEGVSQRLHAHVDGLRAAGHVPAHGESGQHLASPITHQHRAAAVSHAAHCGRRARAKRMGGGVEHQEGSLAAAARWSAGVLRVSEAEHSHRSSSRQREARGPGQRQRLHLHRGREPQQHRVEGVSLGHVVRVAHCPGHADEAPLGLGQQHRAEEDFVGPLGAEDVQTVRRREHHVRSNEHSRAQQRQRLSRAPRPPRHQRHHRFIRWRVRAVHHPLRFLGERRAALLRGRTARGAQRQHSAQEGGDSASRHPASHRRHGSGGSLSAWRES
jgi:hypothetical protein